MGSGGVESGKGVNGGEIIENYNSRRNMGGVAQTGQASSFWKNGGKKGFGGFAKTKPIWLLGAGESGKGGGCRSGSDLTLGGGVGGKKLFW